MTQLQLSTTERQPAADDLTAPSEVVAIFPKESCRAIPYPWEPPSRWRFAPSNRSAAASVMTAPWRTVFAPPAVASPREARPPAAIWPGDFPIVVEPTAQRLRDALPPADVSAVLDAIRDARRGVEITFLKLRRSTEPEDPDWEELVFEVRVDAGPTEALAYWDRVGDRLERATAALDGARAETFARQIAVHVAWE